MPNQIVTRSPKSWLIRYQYWLGNPIKNKTLFRTIQVNSATNPTRSVAERYVKDDLVSNSVLGHSRGQYGYTQIRIQAQGTVQPTLVTTKQTRGTPATIGQTVYSGDTNPVI